MIVAIILGAAAGVVSFVPLIAGLRLARRATPTSNLGHAGALLLGVLLSFLLLAGTMIACVVLAREQAVPFVVSEALGLVVCAIIYGVFRLVRK